MVRGIAILGKWAILFSLIGYVLFLSGCSEFWNTKPCDSWLKDTKGGSKYCSGQRFGGGVPMGPQAQHWTPPVMEPEQISCKPTTKDRRCA